MIKISPTESSILASLLRYPNVPKQERRELLESVSSDARDIGIELIEPNSASDPEIKEAADNLREWSQQVRNANPGRTRKSKLPRFQSPGENADVEASLESIPNRD